MRVGFFAGDSSGDPISGSDTTDTDSGGSDTDAYELLGEQREIKVMHEEGHHVLIRLHEEFQNGDKPDNRGVN